MLTWDPPPGPTWGQQACPPAGEEERSCCKGGVSRPQRWSPDAPRCLHPSTKCRRQLSEGSSGRPPQWARGIEGLPRPLDQWLGSAVHIWMHQEYRSAASSRISICSDPDWWRTDPSVDVRCVSRLATRGHRPHGTKKTGEREEEHLKPTGEVGIHSFDPISHIYCLHNSHPSSLLPVAPPLVFLSCRSSWIPP